MGLLLHRRAVLHQLLGHGLAGGLEHVDQGAGKVLLGVAEEGDGAAAGAGATGTEDFVSFLYNISGKWGEIGSDAYRPIRCT